MVQSAFTKCNCKQYLRTVLKFSLPLFFLIGFFQVQSIYIVILKLKTNCFREMVDSIFSTPLFFLSARSHLFSWKKSYPMINVWFDVPNIDMLLIGLDKVSIILFSNASWVNDNKTCSSCNDISFLAKKKKLQCISITAKIQY